MLSGDEEEESFFGDVITWYTNLIGAREREISD